MAGELLEWDGDDGAFLCVVVLADHAIFAKQTPRLKAKLTAKVVLDGLFIANFELSFS